MQLENELYDFIKQMIDEDSSRLEIVETCISEFHDDYPDYEYDDWSKIVKILMNREDDEEETEISIPFSANPSNVGERYSKALDKLTSMINWVESSPVQIQYWSSIGASKWEKQYEECVELCNCLDFDYSEHNIDDSLYSRITSALSIVEKYTNKLPDYTFIKGDYLREKIPANYGRRRQIKVPQKLSPKDKYITLISSIPALTHYERKELIKRYNNGDKTAFDAIIESYLPSVYKIAQQFNRIYPQIDIQDLIGEGVNALVTFISKNWHTYDMYKSFLWSSIKESMVKFTSNTNYIFSIPPRIETIRLNLIKSIESHSNSGDIVSVYDLTREFNISDYLVNNIHSWLSPEFLDIETIDIEGVENTGKELLAESLSTEIDHALDTLQPREKEILRNYFGIGVPEKELEDIANDLGLTRERVRQIAKKAIRRLRLSGRSRVLATYLENIDL